MLFISLCGVFNVLKTQVDSIAEYFLLKTAVNQKTVSCDHQPVDLS